MKYVVSPTGKVHNPFYGFSTKCNHDVNGWQWIHNAGSGYETTIAMLGKLCKNCFPEQAELLK